tara:strand:+ start:755 stop:1156 length:402 start_codon:yes stop_codon:yes gene_type:complete
MSLLENIIANSQKINFDLSKSLNENIYNARDQNPDLQLPVSIKQATWETIETHSKVYIKNTYSFNLNQHLIYFVTTILEHANKINHHPVILIDENIIEVNLYTKDINDITELDLEYSKFIDEIYKEINYILEF